MNIVILSGGSGNDALVKGLKELVGDNSSFNIKVIVNAYDNGKSTGVCRAVTNTLGVSDIRKNHSRMYKIVHEKNLNENYLEFYSGRYNFTKGKEVEEVTAKLKKWDMSNLIPYAKRFFDLEKSKNFEFNDFSVSNIIYSQMYKEIGYEKTNRFFCDMLNIDDFVILNSFDNVFIKALTKSGHVIEDEGETVFWNNPEDKIIKTIYEVENASFGINKKAVQAIENADLILISTGTFWSSLQPTIEYLDFYKYINEAKAKKIWILNNEVDGDSWGVSSLEFVEHMKESGLNLADVNILLNNDACELLKKQDKNHHFIQKTMGNINGKHDAKKFARAILEIYYGINANYDCFLFDFDDTIFSRKTEDKYLQVSMQNLRILNDSFYNKAIIISGNSYKSIEEKIALSYKNPSEFNVPIWADANTTLYKNDKVIDKIKYLELTEKACKQIEILLKEYNLEEMTTIIGYEKPVNYKIKPLEENVRIRLCNELNKGSNSLFKAYCTGKTTIDILHPLNNKRVLFEKLNLKEKKTLFIGDEIASGNDSLIAKECCSYIEVKDVFECNVILKLLEDIYNELRADNLCGEAV